MDTITLAKIIGAAFVYSFVIQLIYKKLTNQEKIKEIGEKMKKMQKEAKSQPPEQAMKTQNKILELSMQKFRYSSKAMMGSMLAFFAFFEVFKRAFKDFILMSWDANLPLIGRECGWFLTFMIFSMLFNMMIKKALKVEL